MSLWIAIGYGSHVHFFARNLQWFFLGTVVGSMLVGGYLAGCTSAVRGFHAGFFTGLTVWGLALVGALVPLSFEVLSRSTTATTAGTASRNFLTLHGGDMWAFFGALIGGLACALAGATMGATPSRRETGPRWSGNLTEATWTTKEATTVQR
jgi:hypothetical protein